MIGFIQDIGKDFGKAIVMFGLLLFIAGMACRSACSHIPIRVSWSGTPTSQRSE